MTYADYAKMSQDQLKKELAKARKSLFDIQYQVTNKQSKANHEIGNYKRSIAQMMTALNGSIGTKSLESGKGIVQDTRAQASVGSVPTPAPSPKPKKTPKVQK